MVCPCCLPPGACNCPGSTQKVVLIEFGPASVALSNTDFCNLQDIGVGFSRFEDVIDSLSGTTLEAPLAPPPGGDYGNYTGSTIGAFRNLVMPTPGGTFLSVGVGLHCNTNLSIWAMDIVDLIATPSVSAFARASIPTISYSSTPEPVPSRDFCTYSGLVRSINASTSPAQNPFAGRRFGAPLPPDSIGGSVGIDYGQFWERTGNTLCAAVATFEYINIYLETALP